MSLLLARLQSRNVSADPLGARVVFSNIECQRKQANKIRKCHFLAKSDSEIFSLAVNCPMSRSSSNAKRSEAISTHRL